MAVRFPAPSFAPNDYPPPGPAGDTTRLRRNENRRACSVDDRIRYTFHSVRPHSAKLPINDELKSIDDEIAALI